MFISMFCIGGARVAGTSSPHHEPMGNTDATWKCGLSACVCVCLCACVSPTPVCALCACVHCTRAINIMIDTYSLYAYKCVLLSASSILNLEGPIRGGWVGPEWLGGVVPATRL